MRQVPQVLQERRVTQERPEPPEQPEQPERLERQGRAQRGPLARREILALLGQADRRVIQELLEHQERKARLAQQEQPAPLVRSDSLVLRETREPKDLPAPPAAG